MEENIYGKFKTTTHEINKYSEWIRDTYVIFKKSVTNVKENERQKNHGRFRSDIYYKGPTEKSARSIFFSVVEREIRQHSGLILAVLSNLNKTIILSC